MQNLGKNGVYKFAPKRWLSVLFTTLIVKVGNKTLDQHFGANEKKLFFA